jgi:hypothetical protein
MIIDAKFLENELNVKMKNVLNFTYLCDVPYSLVFLCTLFGMQPRGQKVPRLEGVVEEGRPLGVVRCRGRSRSWFWRVHDVLTFCWKLCSLVQS